MGMYSIIHDFDAGEWQFKAGSDNFDVYQLGDKVPQFVSTTTAGQGNFLDGAYFAYGPGDKEGWVVIKNAHVAVLVEGSEHDEVCKRFDVEFDPSLWAEELWAEKERQVNLAMQRFFGWLAEKHQMTIEEYNALPVGQRIGLRQAMDLSKQMQQPGFARAILPPDAV